MRDRMNVYFPPEMLRQIADLADRKKDVYDEDAKLNLKAGNHTVKGEQALAFVRARKNIGDGSDISRIERQQEFLSSAIRKATWCWRPISIS